MGEQGSESGCSPVYIRGKRGTEPGIYYIYMCAEVVNAATAHARLHERIQDYFVNTGTQLFVSALNCAKIWNKVVVWQLIGLWTVGLWHLCSFISLHVAHLLLPSLFLTSTYLRQTWLGIHAPSSVDFGACMVAHLRFDKEMPGLVRRSCSLTFGRNPKDHFLQINIKAKKNECSVNSLCTNST